MESDTPTTWLDRLREQGYGSSLAFWPPASECEMFKELGAQDPLTLVP